MKKILYICDYPYVLYSAIIKSYFESNDENDLLLTNSIDGMEDLLVPLRKSGIFKNIYFYDDVLFRDMICGILSYATAEGNPNIFKKMTSYIKGVCLIFKSQKHSKNIKLPIDLENGGDYDKIYYTDRVSTIMFYLNSKNIPYIAMEHAANIWNIKSKASIMQIKVFYLLEKLHLSCGIGGYTRACKGVLVHKKTAFLPTPPCADVIEWNINSYIQQLTVDQKDSIYNLYCVAYGLELDYGKKYTVLLTNPLYQDNYLNSAEEQLQCYKKILIKHGAENTTLLIKAHPRDGVDYRKAFPDAIIVHPLISSEVLTLSKDLQIADAITVLSSSIYSFSVKTEKIICLYDAQMNPVYPGETSLASYI